MCTFNNDFFFSFTLHLLTLECVLQQRVHTSPPPVSPMSDLNAPVCADPAGRKGCLQTMKSVSCGTFLLNGHLPPPLALEPESELWLMIQDWTACWGCPVERTPGIPPGAWLQRWSMSQRLNTGAGEPLTTSNLKGNHEIQSCGRFICSIILRQMLLVYFLLTNVASYCHYYFAYAWSLELICFGSIVNYVISN